MKIFIGKYYKIGICAVYARIRFFADFRFTGPGGIETAQVHLNLILFNNNG